MKAKKIVLKISDFRNGCATVCLTEYTFREGLLKIFHLCSCRLTANVGAWRRGQEQVVVVRTHDEVSCNGKIVNYDLETRLATQKVTNGGKQST